MTPREAQDGSGGAEGGSAVHGEGSEASASSQGVSEAPLLVRVRVNRPGEPERWVVGAISKNDPAIAAALAEERAKARAEGAAAALDREAVWVERRDHDAASRGVIAMGLRMAAQRYRDGLI